MSLLWNVDIFLCRERSWRERSFLNSSYVKSQMFNSNRTSNCVRIKELHFLVTWKFLNIYVELFLRIFLSGPFWKYPSKQKHVQNPSGTSLPDPKPNTIPNLTLTLPLSSFTGSFFPVDFFLPSSKSKTKKSLELLQLMLFEWLYN